MAACIAPQLFRNQQTREYRIAGCGRWQCPACGRRLTAQWRAVLQWATDHGGEPQYLMTLTLRNALPLWRLAPIGEQAELKRLAVALCQFLTLALTRLVAEIRKSYGTFEYVAFVELTTGRRTPGHRPHLHLLVRGPALQARWLSRRWEFHTRGSFKVDVQRLRSPQHAALYLVGYTVGQRKKEQQVHLHNWLGPRVRYSRGYFPERVAAIRTELAAAWQEETWPKGSWEWLGQLANHWWSRWQSAVAQLTPGNSQEESAENTAKHAGRDRPAGSSQSHTVTTTKTDGMSWRQMLPVCFAAPGSPALVTPAGRVVVSVLPAHVAGELRTQCTDQLRATGEGPGAKPSERGG